jgi:hypothetical protein
MMSISLETLVVTGECDARSSPRLARLTGEHVRNARVVILPRLKHSILLEAPTGSPA